MILVRRTGGRKANFKERMAWDHPDMMASIFVCEANIVTCNFMNVQI